MARFFFSSFILLLSCSISLAFLTTFNPLVPLHKGYTHTIHHDKTLNVPHRSHASLSMGKDLVDFDTDLDGSGCRIGIVKTRWNPEIVDSLYDGVRTALKECGVKDSNIYDTTVPGSFELPLAARFLALSRQCDVVITIGCLIKGETMHFEYIAEAVAKGLMDIQLQTTIPVIFGVLTCLNDQQAIARSKGENNHGLSWGKTAVEMALLRTAALSKAPERATLPLTEGREETPDDKKVERKFGF